MKVLFINDSSSNPNWGDRAAAIALKLMIRKSGCTISGILTEDQLRDGDFGCDKIDNPLAKGTGGRSLKDWAKLLLPPAVFKVRERLLSHLSSRNSSEPIPRVAEELEPCARALLRNRASFYRLLDAIEGADLAVVHGDGCIVGNSILPRTELFLCHLIKAEYGKPVVLINHTADLSHPDLNRMAEAVYPRLDDVTYRDQTSAQVCQGRWPGRYAADSAFLFEPAAGNEWLHMVSRPTYFDVWPDIADFDPSRPYVCVGGSSIYSFDHGPTDAISGFMELVSHLRSTYSGQLVPTASDLKDQTILRPVAHALGLPLVGLTTPVQQAVDIIGNARAYIGGRWHPAIFALRGGTPVVPISSKTFKMQALISMAGLPATTYDALDLAGQKIAIGRTLAEFVSAGESLRSDLRKWAAVQAASSWDNLGFLHRCKVECSPAGA